MFMDMNKQSKASVCRHCHSWLWRFQKVHRLCRQPQSRAPLSVKQNPSNHFFSDKYLMKMPSAVFHPAFQTWIIVIMAGKLMEVSVVPVVEVIVCSAVWCLPLWKTDFSEYGCCCRCTSMNFWYHAISLWLTRAALCVCVCVAEHLYFQPPHLLLLVRAATLTLCTCNYLWKQHFAHTPACCNNTSQRKSCEEAILCLVLVVGGDHMESSWLRLLSWVPLPQGPKSLSGTKRQTLRTKQRVLPVPYLQPRQEENTVLNIGPCVQTYHCPIDKVVQRLYVADTGHKKSADVPAFCSNQQNVPVWRNLLHYSVFWCCPSINPSIFLHLFNTELPWQQGFADLILIPQEGGTYLLPKGFQGVPRPDGISNPSTQPWVHLLPSWTCPWGGIPKEFRPHSLQLAPFDVKEQQLWSELPTRVWAPHSISKAKPCHPHLSRLYPLSGPFRALD